MKRFATTTILGAVGMAVAYGLLTVTVGVGFYRLVPLENEPLTNSVAVTAVSSNRFILADGRVLVMEGYSPELFEQSIRDFGGRVELDTDGSRFASVYVKRKRFICGFNAPGIVIPLFRSEFPRYYRYPLGMGEFQ